MAQIKIRAARPDEDEILTALIMRSKQSNGYDDHFMARCADELRVDPVELEAGEYRVAESSGFESKIMGCVALSSPDENMSAELYALFVDPDYKRLGVGQALWEDLLMDARNRGLTRIHLDADPDAVAFYEAQGFKVTGYSPSDSIEGRNLPHMVMDLVK